MFRPIYITLLAGLLATGACAPDVDRYRADSGRTADFREPSIGSLDQIVWKWRGDAPLMAVPAVADDMLYVTSTDGTLHAIARDDGVVAWEAELEGASHAPPVLMANRILVGTDRGLQAISYEGNTSWTFSADGPVDVAPLVVDSIAYFGTRAGKLWAVDAIGGTPVWSATVAGPITSDAVRWGDVLAVGSSDGRVYRVDLATGEGVGSHHAAAPIWGVAARGKSLFVAAGTRLLSLSGDDEVEWQFELGATVETPPTVTPRAVVVGTGTGDVVALKPSDGSQVFRRNVGAPVRGQIASAGKSFYVPVTSAGLQAVSREGEEEWTFRTDGRVVVGAVPRGGRLYLVDDAGSLYAFE